MRRHGTLVLSTSTVHYLLCGDPISFRLLKQEVMSQYLVQTTLVALSRSDYFILSFMWGPYLVHKRTLIIDKQIEHAGKA